MTARPRICACGLLKRNKVGSVDGICDGCGLPVEFTAEAVSAAASAVVPERLVTTLQALPGYHVISLLGVVTELAATSGLTATAKGTTALEAGMQRLRSRAARLGANAILGLTCSAFGAGGGVTGALGGDAVGVLLMGTGVLVAPDVPGS